MALEWKDVGNGVATIAPGLAKVIGSVVGGPEIGSLAGNAISGLLGLFGLKPDATPDQLNQAIAQDPQSALKLKEAEMNYQVALREKDIEELKARLGDVQNARQREIEITKTTGRRDLLQFWLAVFGWLAPVGLVTYLVAVGLPRGISPDAAALVGGFIGIIIGEYKTVYQYFFGSSKGSEQKTELLTKSK